MKVSGSLFLNCICNNNMIFFWTQWDRGMFQLVISDQNGAALVFF